MPTAERVPTQWFESFAIQHQTKMAKDEEKNAYIHFVDERDLKEVSVVGKHKSKKNSAVVLF